MMLNIKLSPVNDTKFNYAPLATVVTLVLATELSYVLSSSMSEVSYITNTYDTFVSLIMVQHITQLSLILFLFLTIPFLIVAGVLLIALIGAIVLTVNESTDVRRQEIAKQLAASGLSVRTLHLMDLESRTFQ